MIRIKSNSTVRSDFKKQAHQIQPSKFDDTVLFLSVVASLCFVLVEEQQVPASTPPPPPRCCCAPKQSAGCWWSWSSSFVCIYYSCDNNSVKDAFVTTKPTTSTYTNTNRHTHTHNLGNQPKKKNSAIYSHLINTNILPSSAILVQQIGHLSLNVFRSAFRVLSPPLCLCISFSLSVSHQIIINAQRCCCTQNLRIFSYKK